MPAPPSHKSRGHVAEFKRLFGHQVRLRARGQAGTDSFSLGADAVTSFLVSIVAIGQDAGHASNAGERQDLLH